jgi:site-specific DNA recombinase
MKSTTKETKSGITLAYLRVSTNQQDLERQRDTVKRLRDEYGWNVEVIEDADKDSEILLENRPGGKRLLERVRQGGIERVWVPELDRLGRSMYVLSSAFHEFEKDPKNRPVIEEGMSRERYSLLDDPTKILMTSVKFGMASAEKVIIKKRTGEGSWAKAKNSYFWMGGPAPYGYSVQRDATSARPSKTAHLVKSMQPTTGNTRLKSQVDVIKKMYEMIADGASCRDVCDYLNNLHIPPQQRKQSPATRWMPGRVRNIIVNEIYMGMHYYGRHKIYRDPDDLQRIPHHRKNPKAPMPRPVPLLAIVDEKLWHRAVNELKRNNSVAKSGVKNEYLLNGGLIHCQCGRSFSASLVHKKDIWYRCGGRKSDAYRSSGKPQCTVAAIKGEDLEEAVWEQVYGLVLKPGATLRQLEEQMIAQDGPEHSVADDIRDREADLAKREEWELKAGRDLTRGAITDAVHDKLLREIMDEKSAIRADLDSLRAREAEAKTRVAVLETARGVLQDLRGKLLDGKLTRQQKQQIVRALVAGIHVKQKDGGKPSISIQYCFEPSGERYSRRLPTDGSVTPSCRPREWSTITW